METLQTEFAEGYDVKKALSSVLCLLLMQTILCSDAAAIRATTAQTRKQTTQLNQLLEKVGSGHDALVAVRLQDRSVVSGYMGSSGPFSVSLADPKTGAVQKVDYSQVDRLAGYNLATGVQVEQGTGIRGKLARAIGYVIPVKHVQGNHLSGGSKVLLIGIIIGVIVAIVVAKTV